MAILTFSFLLGANSDKWIQLADHDRIFAKGLARDGVRFGPQFMDEVIDGNVSQFGCGAKPSKIAGLATAQIRQISLYSEHHCNPWYEVWAELMWPCEGRSAPRWCESGNEKLLATHLKLEPYFETLTAALRSSDDALERYNLMVVIANRLDDKLLRDYPKGVVGAWLCMAGSVFLEKARPADALGIAWLLSITPFGENASVAQLYDGYLDRAPNMTAEERRLLKEVVRALGGKVVTDETRSILVDRFGPKVPVRPAPMADRTDPSDIALLVERVDAYYRLLRDEKFRESWDFMALDYREGGTEDAYTRTTKSAEDGRKLLRWQVQRIQVGGEMAKVFLEVRRNERAGLGGNKETVREEGSFWVFEDGSWYKLVPWPVDWDYRKLVDVPVPVRQSADHHRGSF